jgi:hypothetical protein
MLVGREPTKLLDLEEVQDRLRIIQQSYAGVRAIPVKQIIGSVARSGDFDKDWLPRSKHVRKRWEQVERAFPDGGFPPISVYKVGDAYFVSDGHHRVAVARQRKMEFIDAEITEITTPIEIGPDTDVAELIHLGQERMFMHESGLEVTRPAVRIQFTLPHAYGELLERVRAYGYYLSLQRGVLVSPPVAAAHWYDNVFCPTVEEIQDSGLADLLKNSTDGDLFLWLQHRRRELEPERGPVSVEDAVKDATEEESRHFHARARAAVETLDDAVARIFRRRDDEGEAAS